MAFDCVLWVTKYYKYLLLSTHVLFPFIAIISILSCLNKHTFTDVAVEKPVAMVMLVLDGQIHRWNEWKWTVVKATSQLFPCLLGLIISSALTSCLKCDQGLVLSLKKTLWDRPPDRCYISAVFNACMDVWVTHVFTITSLRQNVYNATC